MTPKLTGADVLREHQSQSRLPGPAPDPLKPPEVPAPSVPAPSVPAADAAPAGSTTGQASDGKRKYTRKQYKMPVLATLDETYETVPDDEQVTVTETKRDETQVLVDKHVLDSHQSWVAAGKPKAFNDCPRKRYIIAPDEVDGMRAVLRRAETLHKVRVRIAPPVRTWKGQTEAQQGQVALIWCAVDRNPRKDKKDDTKTS